MSKLLNDVIADAKAVKAIAIENAKLALEETFQREVTGLFQNKIKEELAEEEMAEHNASGIGKTVGGSAAPAKQPVTKVVPLPIEKQWEGTEQPVSANGDDSCEISDAELEEILNKLEADLGEGDSAPVDPNAPVVPPVDPAAPVAPVVPTVPAQVDPAAPVAAAPVAPPAVVDPAAPVAPVAAVPAVDPNAPAVPPADPNAQVPAQQPAAEEDSLAEIDLDELLSEIEKEDSDDDKKEKEIDEDLKEENSNLKKQLSEHVKVVEYLREQINEINILNAKLLYTNKLFKQFGLTNEQKLRIVDKFDLSTTLREVKLTYTVLADQFNSGASVAKKSNATVKSITEGLASSPIASTKPSETIVENTNKMALRFQKLAGIKGKL